MKKYWPELSVLLVGALALLWVGCGTPIPVFDKDKVGKWVDETQDLIEWFQSVPDVIAGNKQTEEDPAKFPDENDGKAVLWKGGSENPKDYEVTHDLRFEGKRGGQVRLIQTATKEWENPKGYDVIGVCWIGVLKMDGVIHMRQWDYIRPGQTLRHFPWDLEGKEAVVYIAITGLCRDHRRSVKKRTKILKVILVSQ
jgi:hypothetical protein